MNTKVKSLPLLHSAHTFAFIFTCIRVCKSKLIQDNLIKLISLCISIASEKNVRNCKSLTHFLKFDYEWMIAVLWLGICLLYFAICTHLSVCSIQYGALICGTVWNCFNECMENNNMERCMWSINRIQKEQLVHYCLILEFNVCVTMWRSIWFGELSPSEMSVNKNWI